MLGTTTWCSQSKLKGWEPQLVVPYQNGHVSKYLSADLFKDLKDFQEGKDVYYLEQKLSSSYEPKKFKSIQGIRLFGF